MAEHSKCTYLSGGSLDVSRDYDFTLKKIVRIRYLGKTLDTNRLIKSELKNISNKKKIWIVYEPTDFLSGFNKKFENLKCIQATFKLRYGKYLDNFAIFNLEFDNSISLKIVIDPFIKAYYPLDSSLLSTIGLFESKMEAEKYIEELISFGSGTPVEKA